MSLTEMSFLFLQVIALPLRLFHRNLVLLSQEKKIEILTCSQQKHIRSKLVSETSEVKVPGQKTQLLPVTTGFCLQCERVQLAFIPGHMTLQ